MSKLVWLLFLVTTLYLFVILFRPITAINEDLGGHLLSGKLIVESYQIPKINLLSYTNQYFPFIHSTWFSGVIFYSIKSVFGNSGLILLLVSVVFAACSIQFLYLKKKNRISVIALSGILYISLLSLRTDLRPEIFSMLFISIFITFLYKNKERSSRLLYLLIPAQSIWVNTQIYFIAGPILILLFWIDSIFKSRKVLATKYQKHLLFTLVGTIIASNINPNGIKGFLFPILFWNNYGVPVVENQNIFVINDFVSSSAFQFICLSMAILISFAYLARKKLSVVDWFIIVIFSTAAILNMRNITLFIFATFIPFVKSANAVSDFKPIIKLRRISKLPFLLLYLVGILIVVSLIAKSIAVNGFGFGEKEYGRAAVDFLILNEIKPPYFNNYNIGSYLVYRMYPDKVFVDNRPEAYPAAFFEDVYFPAVRNVEKFNHLDDKYKFNALVIDHWNASITDGGMIKNFLANPKYNLVYLDSYSVIFLKNNSSKKLPLVSEKNFKILSNYDERELVRYLMFFEKAGWNTKRDEAIRLIYLLDPRLCILKEYEKSFNRQFTKEDYLRINCL